MKTRKINEFSIDVKLSEAQKMNEMLSLKTIEKVTSEVLQSLEYKDNDLDIDWIKV